MYNWHRTIIFLMANFLLLNVFVKFLMRWQRISYRTKQKKMKFYSFFHIVDCLFVRKENLLISHSLPAMMVAMAIQRNTRDASLIERNRQIQCVCKSSQHGIQPKMYATIHHNNNTNKNRLLCAIQHWMESLLTGSMRNFKHYITSFGKQAQGINNQL